MNRPLGAMLLATWALHACTTLEAVGQRLAELQRSAGSSELPSPQAAPITIAQAQPPLPKRKPTAPNMQAAADLPDPQTLVGMSFTEAQALLGNPALELEQPPAKVWAYNGGLCTFNVYFYPSVDGSVFRVLTFGVADGTRPSLPGAAETAQPAKAQVQDTGVVRRCFAQVLQTKEDPAG